MPHNSSDQDSSRPGASEGEPGVADGREHEDGRCQEGRIHQEDPAHRSARRRGQGETRRSYRTLEIFLLIVLCLVNAIMLAESDAE